MKVLYYSWASLTTNKGGGIVFYIKNIFQYLQDNPQAHNIEAVYLSSGWYYDNKKKSYIQHDGNYLGVPCYTIVNSTVLAPNFEAVCQLEALKKDMVTKELFQQFINKYGPFDVIHFQSLEGVSPRVLELKGVFPDTKFIHSIHDYGLVCPNVKLWTSEGENCYTAKGRTCCKCMRFYAAPIRPLTIASRIDKLPYSARPVRTIIKAIKKVVRIAYYKLGLHKKITDNTYDAIRKLNIEMINRYSDVELCVSQRVAEIAEHEGVRRDKLCISYIGTKVSEIAMRRCRTNPYSETFTILYMGYAMKSKGFFVLLEALEQIGMESKDISLVFASIIPKASILKRIDNLKSRYKSVSIFNGYSHSQFPIIMKDVNLGIVPPQWEDNLPQVSIEMIANGVPVLSSQYGGAHELNTHTSFCFSNKEDLKNKILEIKNDRTLLQSYWSKSKSLTTMEEHVHFLMEVYNNK